MMMIFKFDAIFADSRFPFLMSKWDRICKLIKINFLICDFLIFEIPLILLKDQVIAHIFFVNTSEMSMNKII